MSAILKFDFQKKRTITFFWRQLSKLHRKDPILHLATTFSLKQGETRTSHGPIQHPLSWQLTLMLTLMQTNCYFTAEVKIIKMKIIKIYIMDGAKFSSQFLVQEIFKQTQFSRQH